jgi:hypothetical protein
MSIFFNIYFILKKVFLSEGLCVETCIWMHLFIESRRRCQAYPTEVTKSIIGSRNWMKILCKSSLRSYLLSHIFSQSQHFPAIVLLTLLYNTLWYHLYICVHVFIYSCDCDIKNYFDKICISLYISFWFVLKKLLILKMTDKFYVYI